MRNAIIQQKIYKIPIQKTTKYYYLKFNKA